MSYQTDLKAALGNSYECNLRNMVSQMNNSVVHPKALDCKYKYPMNRFVLTIFDANEIFKGLWKELIPKIGIDMEYLMRNTEGTIPELFDYLYDLVRTSVNKIIITNYDFGLDKLQNEENIHNKLENLAVQENKGTRINKFKNLEFSWVKSESHSFETRNVLMSFSYNYFHKALECNKICQVIDPKVPCTYIDPNSDSIFKILWDELTSRASIDIKFLEEDSMCLSINQVLQITGKEVKENVDAMINIFHNSNNYDGSKEQNERIKKTLTSPKNENIYTPCLYFDSDCGDPMGDFLISYYDKVVIEYRKENVTNK
jgi:hypothetical protein